MFSFYSKLSTEVYNIDKPIGHSFGDVEFYMERLKGIKGRILEPAVGTGRILIPLLEKGFIVDGIDSSPEMLDLCKLHCKERNLRADLYEENMQSFSLPHKYEAIIIPTGSFLLLENSIDAINGLKCFYEHLSVGGRLIVDIFMQSDFNIGHTSTRTWETPNGDLITLNESLVEVNFINQYTVSHFRYEKWHKSQLIQTELERFPLKWYGVEEFRLILEKVGFSDITISSDYKFGIYPTDNNQVITFEAYRK
ncbi:SAM-dependent methyltransferase [Tissierella sp. P1]|jgi:ubiquinone/menaquinone biosynthesis C-methylase UbiE|uniref:class I SAM-dependent methyltransferase n=1 Tax=Tissierella TaxID=41273 RepID=UPI000BA030D5|nr:class I SAM-dependent methyltransferase [Tissierella sp. P1]MDU5082149.1 class I SAM-dependent methyltransferase [Bacillota bacterium]OZV11252.1 SAM-dependent methyltransferase [Tissierella sp. P1]